MCASPPTARKVSRGQKSQPRLEKVSRGQDSQPRLEKLPRGQLLYALSLKLYVGIPIKSSTHEEDFHVKKLSRGQNSQPRPEKLAAAEIISRGRKSQPLFRGDFPPFSFLPEMKEKIDRDFVLYEYFFNSSDLLLCSLRQLEYVFYLSPIEKNPFSNFT